MTAEQIIRMLKLEPHPEGGYFRETYRSQTMHDFELAERGSLSRQFPQHAELIALYTRDPS